MTTDQIEAVERAFKRRYEIKKLVNLIISIVIFVLGATSVLYIWNYDADGVLTFRWMTVDGTVFTTVIALNFILINIIEMVKYTEVTAKGVYFMRLAAAVAESLIMVVVLLSQLPFSPEHMHIFRYDMFNMHILIPILMVASFLLNDAPIGKLRFAQIFRGMWFVLFYAVVILTLILTGVIRTEQIPYFFLDVTNNPTLTTVGYFAIIFATAFLLSAVLSRWNRKLSWVWFRGVAST